MRRGQWQNSVGKLLETSLQRGEVHHKASVLMMENAVMILFYEGGVKIGTLAISSPGLREGVSSTSSVLLGGKYLVAARALAERVAALYNKMSLVSLNTRLPEGEALRVYSQLLDNVRRGEGEGTDADSGKPKD